MMDVLALEGASTPERIERHHNMAERGMASDGGGVVVRLRRRSTERVIFDLAADQHGVVSRRALIDRGISGSSLDRRVGDLLQRVGPGLYVVDALRDEMTDLAIAIASVPGGAAQAP